MEDRAGTQTNQRETGSGVQEGKFDKEPETLDTIGERYKTTGMKGDPTGVLNNLSVAAADLGREIIKGVPAGELRTRALSFLDNCFFNAREAVWKNPVIHSGR